MHANLAILFEISLPPQEISAKFCVGPLTVFAYFRTNFITMEQQKKYTGFYWILFSVSTVALIAAIVSHFEYLTLILPFFCTSFVKAMDIM
jgi:hypothetical protein